MCVSGTCECDGNWNGTLCDQCGAGWQGSDCNIPTGGATTTTTTTTTSTRPTTTTTVPTSTPTTMSTTTKTVSGLWEKCVFFLSPVQKLFLNI